jgi:hypothetical protein
MGSLQSDYESIGLHGFLGVERYPEFQGIFGEPYGSLPVLLDLREATGADSAFLSELLLFRRRHPKSVAVVIPSSGNLARIFSVVGMGEKMSVYSDFGAALRSLGVATA